MSSYWNSNDTLKGVVLGLFAFILVSSSMPLATVSVHAATSPYFSMTLIAPTSNPQRRQWAAIIQNSFQSANIDAKLIYVSFSQMLGILLGCANKCPAQDFAHGGWDAVFVGNGGGTSLPDFGTQNVAFYRNEGPGDVPPNGQDYYFFKNATFNSLADDYNTNFNVQQRLTDAQKMVAIAAQERPGVIIYYPLQYYAFASSFKPWGINVAQGAIGPSTAAPITSSSEGIDYAHWGGGSVMNVAVTGNIDNVNQLPTAAQNSLYDRYIWGPITDSIEQVDARAVGIYFNGLASSINSSADHKTWTISFKAHNFQDGVPVTADDYIFTTQSQLRFDVGWVGGGTLQGLLGTNGAAFGEFHYHNGSVRYVANGTYSTTAPAGWKPTTVWTYVNPTTFTFTMPSAYILTDPLITAVGAIPMHIYEKVKASTWATSFLSGFTGSSGGLSTNKVTVTWNTQQYGGNGSYAYVYGPIGDGAYMYRGYDPVSQTATLTQWSGYWNASAMSAAGQYTVKTVHIQSILAKDAAIAAFGNHQINFLDTNYVFNPADVGALAKLNATVIKDIDPANGWQEMPLNDNAPVWGTGAGTPVGSAPGATAAAQAAAARNVRKALSYLVPRQNIINNLVGGAGIPGITQFYPTAGVIQSGDIYGKITADPFNATAAASFLAAAGYQTGVAPPPPVVGGGNIPPVTVPPISVGNGAVPSITATCQNQPVPQSTSTTVKVPTFILGNTLTFTGAFQVRVATGAAAGGFAATVQQSTDGGSTWVPVAFGYTTTGGYYDLNYAPTVTGNASYRVFFTGLPKTFLDPLAPSAPSLPESYVPPLAGTVASGHNGLPISNTTTTQYSAVSTYNIGTLADVVNAITTSVNGAVTNSAAITNVNMANGLCGLENSLAISINGALSSLNTGQTNNANSLKNAINGLGNSTNKAITAIGKNQSATNAASTNQINGLSSKIDSLNSQQSNLSSQISTLQTVAYVALGVAIVLGLVAIGLSLRRRSV